MVQLPYLLNQIFAHNFNEPVILGFLDKFSILIKILISLAKVSHPLFGTLMNMFFLFFINNRAMTADFYFVLIVSKLLLSF